MSEDPTKDLTEDLAAPEPAIPDTTDGKLDWLIRELRQLRTEFTVFNQDFNTLNQDFTALKQKVDDRLHDTRPIWQAVQAQLEDNTLRLTRLEEKFDNLILDHHDLRSTQRVFGLRLSALERKAS